MTEIASSDMNSARIISFPHLYDRLGITLAEELFDLLNSGEINVLAHQGELYSHTTIDLQGDGRVNVHVGTVPEGKAYVEFPISSQ